MAKKEELSKESKPSLIRRIFAYLSSKIKKAREEKKLRANQIYLSNPIFSPLEIKKRVAGDFKETEESLNKESMIILIFGKRGSGKSALGFRLLENICIKTGRPAYAVDIKRNTIPKWISPIDNIEEVPKHSIVLIDEGAIEYSSRESMTHKNIALSKLMPIARHKGLSIIFIVQNTGLIDRNVLKLTDTIIIKEGSLLQLEMERAEIKKFYEKAKTAFESVKDDKRKYAYVIDSDFEGLVSHSLPSFWTERLSKNQG